MLFVKRNAQGQIEGAIDYYLVDACGKIVFDGKGSWVWVEQIVLSTGISGRQMIRAFIDDIATALPQALGAYWIRKDKTGQRVHRFTRQQLVKEVLV